MKTQTLIYRVESMTRDICALIDRGASAVDIAKARAKRDAVLATIHSRPDGRRYDRGYT
jgi:hypothetical protein